MLALVSCHISVAQTTSDKQDFYPDWASSIKINGFSGNNPNTTVVADDKGHVYQFLKVVNAADFGNNNDISFGAKSVAMLIKYDSKGEILWRRTIEGGETVTAEALTIDGDKLYLSGSYSNVVRDPNLTNQEGLELVAEQGDKGIEGNIIPTDKKEDQDLYVAVYDLDGNLQSFRSIQSNIEAKGRIELPKQILRHKDKTYLVGYSESYSSFGANPSFDGIEVKVGATNKFAFVFVLDNNFKVEKIYPLVATDDSEVNFSSICSYGDRILLAGDTNARRPLRYNGDKGFKVENLSLIYAELDLTNDQFKTVRSLGKRGVWTYASTIFAGKEGVYLGGNIEGEQSFELLGGKQSEKINGAFLTKWDIKDDKPEVIYPIGSNHGENKVALMTMTKDDKLIIAGDFYDQFNAIDPPTLSFGESDSYIGLFDVKKGELEKLYCYGSTGLEEVRSLFYSKQLDKFFFSGYYQGSAFSLNGLSDAPDGDTYYIASKQLNSKAVTAVEELGQEEAYVSIRDNSVVWLRDTGYVLYNMEGSMLQRGQARQGESLRLSAGLYILRLANGQVVKVLIP